MSISSTDSVCEAHLRLGGYNEAQSFGCSRERGHDGDHQWAGFEEDNDVWLVMQWHDA